MSFRRFVQHDILKRAPKDPYEIIRIAMVIVKNILYNPINDTFKTIRFVKIKSLCYSDILLLQEILVRLSFVKKVENLEAKMVYTNKIPLTQDHLNDLQYIISDLKLISRVVDNSEEVNRYLQDKRNDTEKILLQISQDRIEFKERSSRK